MVERTNTAALLGAALVVALCAAAMVKAQTVPYAAADSLGDFVQVQPEGAAADPAAKSRLIKLREFRSAAYPFKARFSGQSGRVVIRCTVGHKGALTMCASISEQPQGLGFAAAAELAANRAHVASKTVDGADSEGLAVVMVVFMRPRCDDLSDKDRIHHGCADFQPFHPDGEYR